MPANNELGSMPILHPICPAPLMLARPSLGRSERIADRRARVAASPCARGNCRMEVMKETSTKAAG